MSFRAALVSAWLACAAQAVSAGPDVPGGFLADCRECHRVRAPGSGEVPLIEGQHADYLTLQLHYFRERHRDSFPMDLIAAEYGAHRAVALAAEISALPWMSAPGRVERASVEKGAARARVLGCASCHGEDYVGGGVVPRLAGQRRGYLARQLLEIVDELREHPEMPPHERPLEQDDVAAIAAFLAAATPRRPAVEDPH